MLIRSLKNIINRITGKSLIISLKRDVSALNEILCKNDLVKSVQSIATESSAQFIINSMSTAIALTSAEDILRKAISLTENSTGLFLEFGVFSGTSINFIAKNIKCNVYGFDSFEDLPEKWRDGFDKSAFNRDGELPVVEKNVQLIKGGFEDTLPDFLSNNQGVVSLLHVDCDLYSSTKTIFENLGSRIVSGTVIVFDEYFNYPNWEHHEHRAFLEFIKKFNLKYGHLAEASGLKG